MVTVHVTLRTMAFGARRGFALALVVTGILVVVPTAGAQVLPATPNPLPGSAFQGGDGDQAPESEWIDWETLQGEGRVLHSPDPIPDIALEGHNLTPGDWHFATYGGGVSPPASNILDLWFSLDAVDPNTFLYLAFARQQGGMASNYLAFELNRDGDFWENRRGARVPCRHDDDLLVTFVPTGNRVSMLVRRWRTGTDDYDPLTGCAQSGSMDAADVEPNEDVQGAVNASQFSNSLGGTLPAFTQYQFGETAMNLGRVLESAVGSSCGAFTSVWMNSKSSDSDNASMKDFVDPLPINARRCSAAGTKWHDYDADGRRDPGEPGLAGFRIYADLNGNREFDPQGPGERGEPFAITDEHGDYVIDGIRESGQYTLREERTAAAPEGRWNCSYPRRRCAHTVDADANPFAEGRDFGNWRPARVTLTKKLDPPGDPGRFNLSVGRRTLPAAGHLDSRTFRIRPGRRRVSETPAAGDGPRELRLVRGLRRRLGAGAAAARGDLHDGEAAERPACRVRVRQRAARGSVGHDRQGRAGFRHARRHDPVRARRHEHR
jgi:hypothetical protein